MRKSMFYSMLGMAALFLMNGCQKPAEEAPDPVINLDVTEGRYEVPAAGGEVKIAYSVENPVEGVSLNVSAAPNDWATGLKADGTNIIVNVTPELDLDAERSVEVTASYTGAVDVTFTLVQVPDDASKRPSLKVEPSTYEAAAEGGTGSVKYTLTNPVEGAELSVALADAEDSWVSNLAINETDGTVTFDVAENTTVRERSAVVNVTYTALSNPVSFTIAQSAPEEAFKVNDNWTVSYGGRDNDPEYGVTDYINVESSDDERYFVAVFDRATFDQYGIATVAENSLSNNIALYGEDQFLQYLTYVGEASVAYVPFDAGVEYVAIAIGVSDDCDLTGLYKVSEPFEPEELEASEAYNKWIGDWKFVGANNAEFDITLSAASPEVSYTMTGWMPDAFTEEIPVTVNYDSATGSLIFDSNMDLGGIVTQGEQCTLGFYGIANASGNQTVLIGYDIATATLGATETEATVVGHTHQLSNGATGEIFNMQYIGVPDDQASSSVWVYYDQNLVPTFPATMTKVETSGTSMSVGVLKDIRALDKQIMASASGKINTHRMLSPKMARIAR